MTEYPSKIALLATVPPRNPLPPKTRILPLFSFSNAVICNFVFVRTDVDSDVDVDSDAAAAALLILVRMVVLNPDTNVEVVEARKIMIAVL